MGKGKNLSFNRLGDILTKSKDSEWCSVDTENFFTYQGTVYQIDEDVKEYKVSNKSYENEDYTNDAAMDKILVVEYEVDGETIIKFYDQAFKLVADLYVKESSKDGEESWT